MSEDFVLHENCSNVSVEWRIKRFLSLPEEPGYCLHSPAFSLSDAQWFLSICLHGCTGDDSVEWVSLHLWKRFSTARKHAVNCTLGFRRRDLSVFKSMEFQYEFEKFGGYGFPRFLRALQLRQSKNILSSDGTLAIFSTIRLAESTILDEDRIVGIPREVPFPGTPPEEVTLKWKVEGIFPSLSEEEKLGIKSPIFSMAGATWCLKVYPNGFNSNHLGWVSLFLRKECSSCQKKTFAYSLGIRKRDGTPHRLLHGEAEIFTDSELGCEKFLKSSELLDPKCGLVSKGFLTFFCTAYAISAPLPSSAILETSTRASPNPIHEKIATQATLPEQAVHSSVKNLFEELKCLMASSFPGDVSFKVCDLAFPAHRSILALRSLVFFNMFTNDTEENRTGIVQVTDFSPDTISDLLYFIYAGDVARVFSSNAVELYKAAHKYGLQDLMDVTLNCMMQELS